MVTIGKDASLKFVKIALPTPVVVVASVVVLEVVVALEHAAVASWVVADSVAQVHLVEEEALVVVGVVVMEAALLKAATLTTTLAAPLLLLLPIPSLITLLQAVIEGKLSTFAM